MGEGGSTRWTVIRDAAGGDAAARDRFARVYDGVIRAYLGSRWARTPLFERIDDAVQDVFVDCFRDDGALTRARSELPGGFRAFLFGVTRNIARRHERARRDRREVQPGSRLDLDEVEAGEESHSRAFDRAWGRALVQEAALLQARRAREKGGPALRRVELLRMRFGEDLPIRDIARAWDEDPQKLHVDYARARKEFKATLKEVLRAQHPEREIEAECDRLLDMFGS